MAATKSKSSKAKKTSKTNGSKKVAGKTPRAESKMAKVRAMIHLAPAVGVVLCRGTCRLVVPGEADRERLVVF
jgi:hypothetical protein